jgi:hypothetical protein
MELKHICSHCGRLHEVCSCSEYSVTPISFAAKLRMLAHLTDHERNSVVPATVADTIRHEARLAAKKGAFTLMIWLQEKNWTRQEAEEAAKELRLEELEVMVAHETTKWHSHDSWDGEDYIVVNWK